MISRESAARPSVGRENPDLSIILLLPALFLYLFWIATIIFVYLPIVSDKTLSVYSIAATVLAVTGTIFCAFVRFDTAVMLSVALFPVLNKGSQSTSILFWNGPVITPYTVLLPALLGIALLRRSTRIVFSRECQLLAAATVLALLSVIDPFDHKGLAYRAVQMTFLEPLLLAALLTRLNRRQFFIALLGLASVSVTILLFELNSKYGLGGLALSQLQGLREGDKSAASGGFAEILGFAQFMGALGFVFMDRGLRESRRAYTVLGLGCIFLTLFAGSRAEFVGLVLCGLIWIIQSGRKVFGRLLLLAAVSAVFLQYGSQNIIQRARILRTDLQPYHGFQLSSYLIYKLETVIDNPIRTIISHPLGGGGFQDDMTSGPLGVWSDYGLPAFICLFILWYKSLFRFWREGAGPSRRMLFLSLIFASAMYLCGMNWENAISIAPSDGYDQSLHYDNLAINGKLGFGYAEGAYLFVMLVMLSVAEEPSDKVRARRGMV